MGKYMKWVLFAGMGFLLGACDSDELELYQNEPKLYFFKGNYHFGEVVQADSLTYSFRTAASGQDRDTLWVWGWTMGFPVEQERTYTLEQVVEQDDAGAVAGVHYVAFDDPGYAGLMKVPAKAVNFWVPVILLKDPSLDEKEMRLKIRFKENENFKVGIEEQNSFVIRFSNLMTKPSTWDKHWKYAFGAWSSDKMEFVIKYLGIQDFENPPADFAMMYYYKALAMQKLLEHPDEYPGLSF